MAITRPLEAFELADRMLTNMRVRIDEVKQIESVLEEVATLCEEMYGGEARTLAVRAAHQKATDTLQDVEAVSTSVSELRAAINAFLSLA